MSRKMSLENFIKDNRDAFDDLKAPEAVWQKIDPGPKVVPVIWKWSAVAASALLLVAVGYIFGNRMHTTPDVEGWSEYEQTEQYYESRIQEKMDVIKTLNVGDEVMADIKILDDVYHEMKTQLMEDPNADAQMLLSTMIRHQQQKLEVMEEILHRVDKYQTPIQQNHEM